VAEYLHPKRHSNHTQAYSVRDNATYRVGGEKSDRFSGGQDGGRGSGGGRGRGRGGGADCWRGCWRGVGGSCSAAGGVEKTFDP
jgi:hypothetical protein